MKVSRRFIKFALFFCGLMTSTLVSSCKGRTMENMEPEGDTIEVVVTQNNSEEI